MSTAGASTKAPKNAFGDFALKLQRARSVADVEATAAQMGNIAKSKQAKADLRVARLKLRESVKKMLSTQAASENPTNENVRDLKRAFNIEDEKSQAMRREIDESRNNIPPAPRVGGNTKILSGDERLNRSRRDFERLAKIDAIAPKEHQYINQMIQSNEAEDKYTIAKQRYEENQLP